MGWDAAYNRLRITLCHLWWLTKSRKIITKYFSIIFQNPSWPGRKLKRILWIEWRRRIKEDVFKLFFELFFKHKKIQAWCVFRIFFIKKKWTFIYRSTQPKIYFAASQRAYGPAMAKDRVAMISNFSKFDPGHLDHAIWYGPYHMGHMIWAILRLWNWKEITETLLKWCQAIK